MNAPAEWLAAFPIQPATKAVQAICQAWSELSAQPRPEFNPETREPALTKRLKIFIENRTARNLGLLGLWAAEDIIGEVDPATGALIEERRTDIVYGWNDEKHELKLVFEFKRLGRHKRYRDQYLGTDGMARFVTGIYSRRQAVAAMVGVLLDPEPEVVPAIKAALADDKFIASLRLRMHGCTPFVQPSRLFADANFDTEHEREYGDASANHQIWIAHIFLSFGYPTSTRRS
ncbi:MAG: Fis family transcriptional regulator [Gammaproteobacteria bacterium]|nr:Fis family transcriptional regulator [Gammaproteobacteria bacterium]MYE49770.1 Fis family transcriptional regulator [Gammaproteobacteria bacterium]